MDALSRPCLVAVSQYAGRGTHDVVRRSVFSFRSPCSYLALPKTLKLIAGYDPANEKAHAASGHWGVPTFVFENEPFFGQDRIDLLIWRMESRGPTRRS